MSLDFDRFLFRTSMGEDVTDWIECSDTEDEDGTSENEDEWHEVLDYDLAWDGRDQKE